MNRLIGFRSSLAAAVVVLWGFSSQAFAAPNCRSDRKLDVPMQFAVDVQSAVRVHVSAFGGSDKSGWVLPLGYGAWRLYDSSGKQLSSFTTADLGFASNDMLKETNLEGLLPGTSYIIELASQDYCGNVGTFRKSVTMPGAASESNAPVVSTPTVVLVGFQTSVYKTLQFSATDDTGVRHVAVMINGTIVQEYDYSSGVTFRWWCNNYSLDSVQSTLEGPNFYVSYPATYAGPSLVEIVVDDWFGNRSTTSAQLGL
jgi:hypothetical protein